MLCPSADGGQSESPKPVRVSENRLPPSTSCAAASEPIVISALGKETLWEVLLVASNYTMKLPPNAVSESYAINDPWWSTKVRRRSTSSTPASLIAGSMWAHPGSPLPHRTRSANSKCIVVLRLGVPVNVHAASFNRELERGASLYPAAAADCLCAAPQLADATSTTLQRHAPNTALAQRRIPAAEKPHSCHSGIIVFYITLSVGLCVEEQLPFPRPLYHMQVT